MSKNTLPALFVLMVALTLASCASSRPEPPSTVNLSYLQNGIEQIGVIVSTPAVGDLVQDLMNSSIQCGDGVHGELGIALRELGRRGRSARLRVKRDDTTYLFRRRGSRWSVRIAPDHGGRVDIELPWEVAECLSGERGDLTQALRTAQSASASIEIRTKSGERHRFSVSLD